MTTVVAGGDSFVWGSELADSPHGGPNGYSRNTFTALLADTYVCAAYPGNSNNDIAQKLKEVLSKVHTIPVVVVCWTWPSRDKIFTSGRVIKEFQKYCEYHGYPYLFTCADNCLLEVLDQNEISWDNWFMFPAGTKQHETCTPRGFYQWAVENKYDIGPQQHPLELAHQDAYKLIKEKFNEVVKKHLEQNSSRNSISQED